MAEQTTEQAISEIWKLFKETDAKFKETDAKFNETDKRLEQSFAETNAEIAKTNAEVAKTSIDVAKTTASLQKLEGIFGNQWGRLIEALVKPGALALFQRRGHDVQRLYQRAEATEDGRMMEIDIIMEDTTVVIPVEVKSALRVGDVDTFLDDLAEFTDFFPKYKGYQVYGAVAGLDVPQEVSRYAYRNGLYVVSITGNNLAQILNDGKFAPKDFGQADETQTS